MLLASRLKNVFPFYYGWVVVGASGTTLFARMAPNITTLTLFIYPMSQELGWSRTLISGSVSAGALAALVLSPVIGWAIDRYGVRPVLVISMLVLGLSMTSLAWATVPWSFYLAFAAARVVFHTPAPIGSSTVVSRWFIKKRGRAIGIIFLCGAVGGLVFTMLSALMIDHFSIKAAWLSLGLVVFAVSVAPTLFLVAERPEDIGLLPDNDDPPPDAPVVQKTSREQTSDGDTRPAAGVGQAAKGDDSWTLSETMRTKTFWILFFMGMAMFCVNTGTNVHIGAYYRDKGLTLTLAAVAISFSWLVSACGSIVWGWFLEKIQPRYAYSTVFVILGVSTIYLLAVDSVGGAFVAAALIGSVSGGSNVITSIMYANYFGRNSLGRIRGISETGVLLGQSTGPLLAGVLFDSRGSYTFVFLLFGGIALTCSLIVLAARPPVRPQRVESGRDAAV
ncbi:MAG: MFS transporter [Chloroflexi bacterium]|nr:MFS transporter [Chloroflexota bacterium]MDA1272231.1 MFS transporter [Chloroflexota bacterium]